MSTFSAGTGSDPPPLPSPPLHTPHHRHHPRCPRLKWAVFRLRFWTELDYATKTLTSLQTPGRSAAKRRRAARTPPRGLPWAPATRFLHCDPGGSPRPRRGQARTVAPGMRRATCTNEADCCFDLHAAKNEKEKKNNLSVSAELLSRDSYFKVSPR